MVAKQLSQSDLAQTPPRVDKVVAGKSDSNSAEVLLGREAEFADEEAFRGAHRAVGNRGGRLVGNRSGVVFADEGQGAA